MRHPKRLAWMLGAALLALACSATPRPETRTAPPPAPAGGRLIMVTLPPGPPQLWSRVGNELAEIYDLETVHRWPLTSLGEQCIVFRVPEYRTLESLTRRLATDPRVASVQPIYRFQVSGGYNDPYAELQHGAQSLHLERAHRWATGKGVRVAIVDTGVDVSHPDLEGRVIHASNFVVEEAEATFTTDIHGTAVAGVIAARANNGIGIVGVAPDAELLALKACWQDPPDSREAVCDSYTLAKAFDAALQAKPQVLNLSVSGPADPLLTRMIDRAVQLGIVIVAAAEPEEGSTFPASLDDVLGISASPLAGKTGEVTPTGHPGGSLAAPGTDILTTVPRGAYDFLSGSSFAAAHVSGFVALLLEREPGLTPEQLRAILTATAKPETPEGEAAGTALLDGCAALSRVLGSEVCGAAAPGLAAATE